MLELTSAGRPVHLSPGTSAQLEYHSPLFDEDAILGTFAYSFSVPAGPNGPLYGHPERPDALGPATPLPAELADDGVPLLTGTQRVKAASAQKYSVAVAGGLSGAGLNERPLASFQYGGLREVPRLVPIDPAPGSLLMPGLVRHANEVVANPTAYPYVFAPLRNEYVADDAPVFGPADPLQYPRNTVNAWGVRPVPLLGMPAGGSFGYNVAVTVPGGVQFEQFQLLPPYCPFPRLRYVLQSVLEECGLVVDLEYLLPGELGDLIIAGNAQLVDRGDADTLRFQLADVLPELTVGELLAALRQDLGVALYVDPATGRVRSAYVVEAVAADAAYVDLTGLMAGGPEATRDAPQGVTLTYGVDPADALTKDALTLQPAVVLPAVATVAALPATAPLSEGAQAGQVRLVQADDTYYSCALSYRNATEVNLTWTPLVVRLPTIAVNGGGETLAQRVCYTVLRPTTIGGAGLLDAVPAISQPPYVGGQNEVERSPALRLLFYNGRQPTADGVSTYPQLSPHAASGALSLRLSGPTGTYAQLLAGWLGAKLSGTSYKQPLRLAALDLARLDLTQPVRLDGVPYLVRKLSAAVPLRKPVSAELVRLF